MKKLLALVILLLLSTAGYAQQAQIGPFGAIDISTLRKTVSETASTETYGVAKTITSPLVGSVSGAVQVGGGTDLIMTGTGSLTGTGHAVALLGRNTHSGSGTIPLQIGTEGVLKNNGGGTVSYGAVVAANMNDLSGGSTYTLLAGFSPVWGGIASPGSITTLADFYSANDASVTNIPSTRYTLANLDAGKIIYTVGKILNATGKEVAAPAHPGIKTGRYYSGLCQVTLTPAALTANALYFSPILIPERTTFTEIGTRVTTLAGGTNVQMAIYKAEGGVPTTKILNTASISSATTGAKTEAISQQLEAGTYFLAVASGGTPTLNWAADYCLSTDGWSTDNGLETTMYSAGTFGTWPDSPSVSYLAAGHQYPQVWLKK